MFRSFWTLIAISVCFLVAFSLVTVPAYADFKVGAAKTVITPDPLLPISGGVGPGREATSKKGELTARAMVLEQGETRVAIVGLDLLGFPSVLSNRVRERIRDIPGENILVGASHTHSAPDCYAFPNPATGGHTGDLEYMDFVCDQIVEAIKQAYLNRQPASIRVNTAEAEGRIAYNYYAPDLYDRRMSVIQAVDADHQPIVTLVNYALHPEVLGTGPGIVSPDCIGPMCDKIESEAGGMALFMNGAQGGMVTADNRNLQEPKEDGRGYWQDQRTWEECLRIGHQMADESLRIIKPAKEQSNPDLYCKAEQIRFPVDSPLMWAIITASPLNYPHNDDQSISTQVNLINLGNIQILTIPGEALPNIGFYLKRKMNGKHNVLFGLTNDAFGYIMTEVDYYSFPRYKYISQTSLGEQTGEILIKEGLRLAKEAPQPE
ncbi:Neutral/alkaline non-lysosomal ceramidase [Polystyrenella longa]|uniref:Neutral ceramidase n=1 Tax=Polystyrenella longa TaxID=2528007 RepID=A0A518CHP9_9PLAN|nr:neutral/alkaline non-lysosomal ceramidase N-terminal domain-containing protein [Polystyrenella longa]QDU78756.1 Neutral/alkaline non-lysosomal ceramidase [Polystyrenella longa]